MADKDHYHTDSRAWVRYVIPFLGMKGGQQLLYLNAGCFRNGLIVPVQELIYAYAWVRARAQSDTGVGWVLNLKLITRAAKTLV